MQHIPRLSIRSKLINGSDEYWEYKDTAEKIYWDFCEARTTDARRMYKQEGEALKRKMISKYGADDESVKTIIERFNCHCADSCVVCVVKQQEC